MLHRPGRRLTTVLAVALVTVFALTASAVAAGGGAPVLVKPGKRVHGGHVRLVVKDTSADARKYHVFVTINHHKQLDKYHNLANCNKVTKGCDFLKLKAWRGHRGLWTTKARFKFNGYWATTPGTYFWQAQHVGNGPGGLVTSKIKSFRVT